MLLIYFGFRIKEGATEYELKINKLIFRLRLQLTNPGFVRQGSTSKHVDYLIILILPVQACSPERTVLYGRTRLIQRKM